MQVYVLSSDLQPVPVGISGQCYIGGIGVGNGYVNEPQLTAERFLPHPYGAPGERLYATGDLAKYTHSGNIEFLGRADHQVKIRGYRIELGDIENVIASRDDVKQCVALVSEDPSGAKRITAYIVTKHGITLAIGGLRRSIKAKLPTYMVPSEFFFIGEMPLTPNGKINRAALRLLQHGEPAVNRGNSGGEIENELVAIWAKLGIADANLDEDLFTQGAHSLQILKLIHAVKKRFDVTLRVADVYLEPTVRSLAKRIKQANTAPLDNVDRPRIVALNFGPDLASALGGSYDVYALPAVDFDVLKESVREVAERFIVSIRDLEVSPPFAIVGFSQLGAVAYEIATRLASEVSQLVLVDAPFVEHARVHSEARPISTPLILILAKGDVQGVSASDPRLRWQEMATGETSRYLVAGRHFDLMERPGILEVARKIRRSVTPIREETNAKDDTLVAPFGAIKGKPYFVHNEQRLTLEDLYRGADAFLICWRSIAWRSRPLETRRHASDYIGR